IGQYNNGLEKAQKAQNKAFPLLRLLCLFVANNAYTNSTRSPYCGTCTFQPNFSLICPAIAFAASGSPCVRNVVRGPLPSIPLSQRRTSSQSACAEKPPIFSLRQRTGTHCPRIFTSGSPSCMRRPVVPAA